MADRAATGAPVRSRMVARVWSALVYVYPVLVMMLLWEVIAHSGMISRLLWPPLEQIGYELYRFAMRGDLAFHGGITLQRALAGFLAAIVVGILIGVLLARVRLFNRLIEPIFVFGYPIPKISLYPMFIFIFGFGDLSKIVLIFLECLYPITVQTMAGMRNVERVLVW